MANDILGTYSPERFVIVISKDDFIHTVSGYADGTFLNLSRPVPASTLYSGSDNSKARVKRSNRDTEITLTLHQASVTNAILQALQKADENALRNEWTFSITLKDTSGTGVWSSNQAFISNVPDAGFGSEIDTRDWMITAVSLDSNIGANTLFDQAEVSAMAALGQDVPVDWQLQ